MSEPDVKSHKIEFPCADYPIKVIGDTVVGFKDTVIEILSKHAKVDLSTLLNARARKASTPPCNCTSLPPAKISCTISTAPCALPAS